MQSENNSDLPSFTTSNQQDDENFSIDPETTRRFLEQNSDLAKVINLLSYNQMYLELVDQLIPKVDKAIEKNRNLQAQIRAKLINPHSDSIQHRKRELPKIPCWPPYFKDSNGMAPNSNQEALEISRICSVSPLIDEQRRWNSRECDQLRVSVCNSLKEQQILSLEPRKELYLNKLRLAGVETTDEQKAAWREEVEKINRRAIYLRHLGMDEFLRENCDYSRIDWAKICAMDFQGTRTIQQLKQKWRNEMAHNTSEFSVEEDVMILEMAKEYSNWDTIAEKLATQRSAFNCFQRFIYLQQTQKEATPWTPDEDQKLLKLISVTKVGDEIPWGKIAMYIPDRDKLACEYRYKRSLCEKLRHGRWTEAEDMLLLEAINKYGPQNWGKIAESVKGRSALQCRDRWIHVLDHKRRDLPWTWEEHQRLLYGVRLFGRDECAKIAKLIPGRNNMDIRMRIRQEEKKDKKVVYRHFANNYLYCKMRRKSVVEEFGKFLEAKQDDRKEMLASRLGLGSFVAKPTSGMGLDYTKEIKKRNEEFNDWKIQGSGRWVKTQHKNPNEYDREDLVNELRKLPEEQMEEILSWLAESDRRLEAEKEQEIAIPDDPIEAKEYYDKMFPEEKLIELSDQVKELLPPREQDYNNYNQYKKRPPKIRIKKPPMPKREKKKQIRKRRKKTKLVKILENIDKLDENQVQSLRWSDRLMVEVLKEVENMPAEERRMHLMQKLCYVIRQRVHFTAVYKYKKDLELKERIQQRMLEYVKHVVDDPPAPIPVMKPPDPMPVQLEEPENASSSPSQPPPSLENVVILPANWQNMSLRELTKLKISPELYQTLAQQAQMSAQQVEQQTEPSSIVSRARKHRKSGGPPPINMERFKNTIIMPTKEQEMFNAIQIEPLPPPPPEPPRSAKKKRKRPRLEVDHKPLIHRQPHCVVMVPPESLPNIVNKLLPPTLSTLNAVKVFQTHVRSRLKKGINLHFYLRNLVKEDIVDEQIDEDAPGTSASFTPTPNGMATSGRGALVDDEMRSTKEYMLLKKRMYRFFFLPMALINTVSADKEEEDDADENKLEERSHRQKKIQIKEEQE